MSTYAADPPVSWHVVAQLETTEVQAGNQPVQGVRITFSTGLGTTGSLFVPRAQYQLGAAVVQPLIAAAAANADSIASLTSESQ